MKLSPTMYRYKMGVRVFNKLKEKLEDVSLLYDDVFVFTVRVRIPNRICYVDFTVKKNGESSEDDVVSNILDAISEINDA